jgi:hypothetical protein
MSANDADQCFEILKERHCDLVILDYYLSSRFSVWTFSRDTTCARFAGDKVTAYGNEEWPSRPSSMAHAIRSQDSRQHVPGLHSQTCRDI